MKALGLTISAIGELLVALTVVMVHRRVRQEGKIDRKVFREMRQEQFLAVFAMALIAGGYVIQLYAELTSKSPL